MTTALLLIDIQKDYFPDGAFPLPDIQAASAECTNILKDARQNNLPIIHIQHQFPEGKGPFLCARTKGAEIHESVTPLADETIITKEFPNSFNKTGLHDHLQDINCQHVVIVGAMTQMCVAATARAALDLGYRVTICENAIASQSVDWNGTALDTSQVNAAFLSALAMAQVRISSSTDIMREW